MVKIMILFNTPLSFSVGVRAPMAPHFLRDRARQLLAWSYFRRYMKHEHVRLFECGEEFQLSQVQTDPTLTYTNSTSSSYRKLLMGQPGIFFCSFYLHEYDCVGHLPIWVGLCTQSRAIRSKPGRGACSHSLVGLKPRWHHTSSAESRSVLVLLSTAVRGFSQDNWR